LQRYVDEVCGRPLAQRGTTHISVIDGAGNAASLTLSNGEGCGHLIPETGIMPNNMLGEEDLNPAGFHRWPLDQRMVSMMAPTMALSENGDKLVTGSGGSNRIRSAILQLLVNRIDRQLPLHDAVHAPRIHLEKGLLSIEGGHSEAEIRALTREWPNYQRWDEINLFFGGAHSVEWVGGGLEGAGDPRRDGVCLWSDAGIPSPRPSPRG
jgi:gamma-glutamyltranspeptidase/glutathione hydrolase